MARKSGLPGIPGIAYDIDLPGVSLPLAGVRSAGRWWLNAKRPAPLGGLLCSKYSMIPIIVQPSLLSVRQDDGSLPFLGGDEERSEAESRGSI